MPVVIGLKFHDGVLNTYVGPGMIRGPPIGTGRGAWSRCAALRGVGLYPARTDPAQGQPRCLSSAARGGAGPGRSGAGRQDKGAEGPQAGEGHREETPGTSLPNSRGGDPPRDTGTGTGE